MKMEIMCRIEYVTDTQNVNNNSFKCRHCVIFRFGRDDIILYKDGLFLRGKLFRKNPFRTLFSLLAAAAL